MWKRAFILLLSLHLMVIILVGAWYLSLPRLDSVESTSSVSIVDSNTSANVKVEIGEQAVNMYLAAAISEQPDIHRILAYAKVDFQDVWNCDVGIKLDNRIVPFQVTFIPSVENGNLDLQVVNATMDNTAMKETLANIVQLLPLPNWITFEASTDTVQINFSDLPQHQFGIQAVDYSAQSHLLTLMVSVRPKFN